MRVDRIAKRTGWKITLGLLGAASGLVCLVDASLAVVEQQEALDECYRDPECDLAKLEYSLTNRLNPKTIPFLAFSVACFIAASALGPRGWW